MTLLSLLLSFGLGLAYAAPSNLVQRDDSCPAGSAPAIQTVEVHFVIAIDQYISSNTVLSIPGARPITINNAPTRLVTTVPASSTSASSVTTESTLPTPFFVSIVVNSANNGRKRDVSGTFVGDGGATTDDCSDASTFGLDSGVLRYNGNVISTEPGVSSIVLTNDQSTGSIKELFAVSDTLITWSNAAFFGGKATFCFSNGILTANFDENAQNSCTPVLLKIQARSTCPAAASSSIASASETSTASSSPTAVRPSTTFSISSSTLSSMSTTGFASSTSGTISTTSTISSSSAAPVPFDPTADLAIINTFVASLVNSVFAIGKRSPPDTPTQHYVAAIFNLPAAGLSNVYPVSSIPMFAVVSSAITELQNHAIAIPSGLDVCSAATLLSHDANTFIVCVLLLLFPTVSIDRTTDLSINMANVGDFVLVTSTDTVQTLLINPPSPELEYALQVLTYRIEGACSDVNVASDITDINSFLQSFTSSAPLNVFNTSLLDVEWPFLQALYLIPVNNFDPTINALSATFGSTLYSDVLRAQICQSTSIPIGLGNCVPPIMTATDASSFTFCVLNQLYVSHDNVQYVTLPLIAAANDLALRAGLISVGQATIPSLQAGLLLIMETRLVTNLVLGSFLGSCLTYDLLSDVNTIESTIQGTLTFGNNVQTTVVDQGITLWNTIYFNMIAGTFDANIMVNGNSASQLFGFYNAIIILVSCGIPSPYGLDACAVNFGGDSNLFFGCVISQLYPLIWPTVSINDAFNDDGAVMGQLANTLSVSNLLVQDLYTAGDNSLDMAVQTLLNLVEDTFI